MWKYRFLPYLRLHKNVGDVVIPVDDRLAWLPQFKGLFLPLPTWALPVVSVCQFYLQDTKSSNGTFINSQRLSRGSEESPPCEVLSGDLIQFGVDVTENTRKGRCTHSQQSGFSPRMAANAHTVLKYTRLSVMALGLSSWGQTAKQRAQISQCKYWQIFVSAYEWTHGNFNLDQAWIVQDNTPSLIWEEFYWTWTSNKNSTRWFHSYSILLLKTLIKLPV